MPNTSQTESTLFVGFGEEPMTDAEASARFYFHASLFREYYKKYSCFYHDRGIVARYAFARALCESASKKIQRPELLTEWGETRRAPFKRGVA